MKTLLTLLTCIICLTMKGQKTVYRYTQNKVDSNLIVSFKEWRELKDSILYLKTLNGYLRQDWNDCEKYSDSLWATVRDLKIILKKMENNDQTDWKKANSIMQDYKLKVTLQEAIIEQQKSEINSLKNLKILSCLFLEPNLS